MSFLSKIELKKGWNLVNFSLKNISLKKIIENDNIIEIRNNYESYNKNVPSIFNTLNHLDIKSGYWIKTNEYLILEINGTIEKSNITLKLNKGWNLIGYPYILDYKIEDFINNKITEIKNIYENYNIQLLKGFNNLSEIKKNCAYLVYSISDTVLTLKYPYKYNLIKDGIFFGFITYDNFEVKEKNFLNNRIYDIKSHDNDLYNFMLKVYNNNNNLEGIKIETKIELPKMFEGKVCLNKSTRNIIEIQFIDKVDTYIIINFKDSNIILKNSDDYYELNKISIKELKPINTENLDSYFLSDYKLSTVSIKNINFFKNDKQIKIKNFDSIYNDQLKQLKLSLLTIENETFIYNIKTSDTIEKSLEVEFLGNNYNSFKNRFVIIKNNLLKIKNSDNLEIYFDWDGIVKNKLLYAPQKFSNNSDYLYWYDFTTLNFSFNNIDSHEIIESNEDYIIIKSLKYYLYFIKSIDFIGSINFMIVKENEIKYNQIIPLFNGIQLVFDIKISWEGKLKNSLYVIKNLNILGQREIGEMLNTFKYIRTDKFSFKIHYFIGDDNKSIKLEKWDSYSYFIEVIESLINYYIKYFEVNNLYFYSNDNLLKINGGDGSYDIYITNVSYNNIVVNTVENNNNSTNKVSYIVLSSSIDYTELKNILFKLILKAIISSYNTNKWIEDNIYLAIYNNFTNNINLKPISIYLENNFLSLNFINKIEFSNGIINLEPGFNRFLIDLIEIEQESIEILDIYQVEFKNLNNTIGSYKIEKFNDKFFLKIEIKNNNYFQTQVHIIINKSKVTLLKSSLENFYYGSNIFFMYLSKVYGNKIFANILKNQKELPLNNIENAIESYDKSKFEKIFSDFWILLILSKYNKTPVISIFNKFNLNFSLIDKPQKFIIKKIFKSSVYIFKIDFPKDINIAINLEGEFSINDFYRKLLYITNDNKFIDDLEYDNDITTKLYDNIKDIYFILVTTPHIKNNNSLKLIFKEKSIMQVDKKKFIYKIKVLNK